MRFIPFLLLLGISTGCATLNTVKEAPPGTGRTVIYEQPYQQVYDAALETLTWLRLDIAEQNREEHYILASHGISALSWGERVRVTFDPLNESRTQVTILSKRVVATNFLAADWQKKFLDTLTIKLGSKEQIQAVNQAH